MDASITITAKKQMGQFYTTNYAYILQHMHIPDDVVNIIEPFAGNGDLLNFITNPGKYNISCYDIDPKNKNIQIAKQDTLLHPPVFDNAFVITNPPFLARNKSPEKSVFDKYNTNDLYKCFLQILIATDGCVGGILIVPLNFICSIRKNDIELKRNFIEKYNITTINIFEEPVFEDTTYTVCSFQFTRKIKVATAASSSTPTATRCCIFPHKKIFHIHLQKGNHYTIGGELYDLPQTPHYKIERATRITPTNDHFTNILAKCIDDNITSQIQLSIVDNAQRDIYIDHTPKLTARSYAILVIYPILTTEQQIKLVDDFNGFLREKRDKYNSLFLTNYRESNTICRKRISFDFVYKICNHLLLSVSP